jgi:tight adherence protein B
MHDLWELIERIPINNQTVLIGAAQVAVLTLLLFLGLRQLWNDWFAAAEDFTSTEEVGILAQRYRQARPKGVSERLDSGLENLVANTGLELNAEQAAAWIALAAVGLATALFLIRAEWWMAALGFVLGSAAVLGLYYFYYSRYRWKIREQLPDIFMMLAQSARAGLSLDRAVELIGQQKKIALADEFRRCSSQLELGLPVVAALQSVADRLQLLDFNALVALIALHKQSGGNLPLQLERLATSTRDHNQFRSYLHTATTLSRTSALCIGLATPVILLAYAVFQPEYAASFFESRQAWTLIGVALGLELIGAVWIYRVLKIDY